MHFNKSDCAIKCVGRWHNFHYRNDIKDEVNHTKGKPCVCGDDKNAKNTDNDEKKQDNHFILWQ